MSEQKSIDDQKDYYNQYWAQRSRTLNSHEILRLSRILEELSILSEEARRKKLDLQICDFGSGWGWLSNYLSAFGSVLGVELSDDAVRQAQQDFPHVEFVCADITKWRPGRQFDLLVSSEVLEHVPDKQAFFTTVREVLRPDGWLILTTPNKKVQKEWDMTNGTGQLIENWCSVDELRRLAVGFEIIDHRTFLFDFSYCGKFRWLSAPKAHYILRVAGCFSLYDYFRRIFDLGLYQVMLARKKS